MKSLFPNIDDLDELDDGLSGTESPQQAIPNMFRGVDRRPAVQLYGRELFEQELEQQIPVYVHPDDPNAPLPNDGYNPVLNRDSLGDLDGSLFEGLSGDEIPKAGDQVYIPTPMGSSSSLDSMGEIDVMASDEIYSFEDQSKQIKKQSSSSLGQSIEALHQKKEMNTMSRDRFSPNAALDDGRNMGIDYSDDFYEHSEYGDYVKETPKVAIRELGDPLSEIEGESKNPVTQFNSLPRFGKNINSSRFASSITNFLQSDGRLDQTGFGAYETSATPAQEGAIIFGSGIDYATASMGEIFDEAEADSEGLGALESKKPAFVLNNKSLQKQLLAIYNKIDSHQDAQERAETKVKKLIQSRANASAIDSAKMGALMQQCVAIQTACQFLQHCSQAIKHLNAMKSRKGLSKQQLNAIQADLSVLNHLCRNVLSACAIQSKDACEKATALVQYCMKMAKANPANKNLISMLNNRKAILSKCISCRNFCTNFGKSAKSMGAYTQGSGDMGLARKIGDSMGAYTAGSGDMGLARKIGDSMGAYTAGSGDMGLARKIGDSMGAYTAGSGDMGLARKISESMGAYTAGSGDMGLARKITESMGDYIPGSGDMGLARQIGESMGEFGVAYDYDLHDRIDSYDMESDNAGLDLAGDNFLACYGTLDDADHDEDDDGLQGLSGMDGLDCVSGLSAMHGWMEDLKKGLNSANKSVSIVINPSSHSKAEVDQAKKLVSMDVAKRIQTSSKSKVAVSQAVNPNIQALNAKADARIKALENSAKQMRGAQLQAVNNEIKQIQDAKKALPTLAQKLQAKRKECSALAVAVKNLQEAIKKAPITSASALKAQLLALEGKKALCDKELRVIAADNKKARMAISFDSAQFAHKLRLTKPAFENVFKAYDKVSQNALINSDIKSAIQQLRSRELSQSLAEINSLIAKDNQLEASVKLEKLRVAHDNLAKFIGAVGNIQLPVLFAPKLKTVVKPKVAQLDPKFVKVATPQEIAKEASKVTQAVVASAKAKQTAPTSAQKQEASKQLVIQSTNAVSVAEQALKTIKQISAQAPSKPTPEVAVKNAQNASVIVSAVSQISKAVSPSDTPNASAQITQIQKSVSQVAQQLKNKVEPTKPLVMPSKVQVAANLATKKVALEPQKSVASLMNKPKLAPGQNTIKPSGVQTKALVDTRDERAGIQNLSAYLNRMEDLSTKTKASEVSRTSEGKALLNFVAKNIGQLKAIILRCKSNIEVLNHFNQYLLKNAKPVPADSKKAIEVEKTINLDLAKANGVIIDPFKKLFDAYKVAAIRGNERPVITAVPTVVTPQQLPIVVQPQTSTPPQPQILPEIKASTASATPTDVKTAEVVVQPAPTSSAPGAVAVVAEVKTPASEIQSQAQAIVAAQPDVSQKDIDVGNSLFEKAGIRFTSLAPRHQKYLQQMAVLLASDVAKNVLKNDEAIQILQNQIGNKVAQQIQESKEAISADVGTDSEISTDSISDDAVETLGGLLGVDFSMDADGSYGLNVSFEQFWSDDILSDEEYKVIRDNELQRIHSGVAPTLPANASAVQIEKIVAAEQGESSATSPDLVVQEALVVDPQEVLDTMALFSSNAEGNPNLLSMLQNIGMQSFGLKSQSNVASSAESSSASENVQALDEIASSDSDVSDSLVEAPTEATEEVMQGFTDWLNNITP